MSLACFGERSIKKNFKTFYPEKEFLLPEHGTELLGSTPWPQGVRTGRSHPYFEHIENRNGFVRQAFKF
jgi:hypothetical protein